MFKKLIKNALISIFMDKHARDNFKFYEKNKYKSKSKTNEKNSKTHFSEESKIVKTNKLNLDETHLLIIESVKAAKLEIDATSKSKLNKKRQALINKALKIQNSKTYVLDNLSDGQRQKLKTLALNILNYTPSSSTKIKDAINKK